MSNKDHTFIIDTNVILNDYDAPFRLAKYHSVIIPITVIQELDHKKKALGSVGMNARRFHARLKEELIDVKVNHGTFLKVSKKLDLWIDSKIYGQLIKADEYNNDLKILSVAKYYSTNRENVKLLTNDNNMLIQAITNGIIAESVDQHKSSTHFTGISDVIMSKKMLQDYCEHKGVILTEKKYPQLFPNQIVILKVKKQDKPIGFAMFLNHKKPLIPMYQGQRVFQGIKAKNKEQEWTFAMCERMYKPVNIEDQIDLLTIEGPAGSGKTLMAVASAIEMSKKMKNVPITLTKPLSVMGNQETGFLPGSLNDKQAPFMQSYVDILDQLDCLDMATLLGDKNMSSYSPSDDDIWDKKSTVNKVPIEFNVLSHIRGRNMRGIILVDEAQNLTRHELKTLITRATEGAKVILIADIGQIDVPLLDQYNNGFSYVTEKLKELPFTAHIALIKSERSRLAAAAGDLL